MSQIMQSPDAWAEEDARGHRDRMDKKSEQQVGIFLAVAKVLKKWDSTPISRADFDAGMEAARRC